MVYLYEDRNKYVKRREGWGDYSESYSTAATHKGNNGNNLEIVIMLPDQYKGQCALILAHECLHVVQFINEAIGSQNDEWDAYTLAYLMGTVFKRAPFMRTR